MKMGIPECQLELNVYGLIPDIPTIEALSKNIPLHVTPEDILDRSRIEIDVNTGYRLSAIRKMQQGRLQGSFRELYNTKYMPDFNGFVAGEQSSVHPIYTSFPISPYFKELPGNNMFGAPMLTTQEDSDKSGELPVLLLFLIFSFSIILTVVLMKRRKKIS
jgi:hypothetical protein